MINRIILLSLVCLLGIKSGFSQSQTAFDSVLKKHTGFNGVVLVADQNKIVFEKAVGFAEYEKQKALQKNDIFELASISKQFTAMIVLMLKEKKLLDLQDPVSKYVKIPYPNIKIVHLLTHTSGLPDYQAIMDQHWDKSKVAGNKDIIEYLNKFAPPSQFEPGSKYEYSNTGYVILASIAEKAAGKDFIWMCRNWIFKPLGMTSTDIRTLQEKAALKNAAIGHIYVEESKRFIRADSFPSSNYTIWLGNRKGPGRISSTAEDLFKWDQALYTNKLISKELMEEAFRSFRLNDGSFSHYGYGWELPDNTYLGRTVTHTGDNPGYHNQITRNIGRHKTIIILSNNAYRDTQGLTDDFAKLVY